MTQVFSFLCPVGFSDHFYSHWTMYKVNLNYEIVQ